uniref:hypothetical protein n=1 Tax=Candidatus Enterococcus willemsii TaxID=1857215 RepID=UPI00403F3EA9
MTDLIYVHIDTISNAVLTHGITTKDFHQGIIHQPKNLLLLNPSSELGEFETHSGMKIIRGSEAVNTYFQLMAKSRDSEENKWIDFSDPFMLKELTPLEISELLYFGHMKIHLHSPFFYKLQNNFVYFDLKDQMARTYYRYLDEFYRILSNKLRQLVFSAINSKRKLFKKPQPIANLPFDLMKTLREAMKEGLAFSFQQATQTEQMYQVPIFIVEDARFIGRASAFTEDMLVGYLNYQLTEQTWSLDIEDFLGFSNMTTPLI